MRSIKPVLCVSALISCNSPCDVNFYQNSVDKINASIKPSAFFEVQMFTEFANIFGDLKDFRRLESLDHFFLLAYDNLICYITTINLISQQVFFLITTFYQ